MQRLSSELTLMQRRQTKLTLDAEASRRSMTLMQRLQTKSDADAAALDEVDADAVAHSKTRSLAHDAEALDEVDADCRGLRS
jgi:hypothetical protein